jgi:hypothetical protein
LQGEEEGVFGKRGLFVLVVLAAAAALTTSAGAANRGSARIDLSTRGGVAVYLASQGVSMQGVVIQRGSRNYAGPSCPGKGWTCTTAKRVVQIAKGNGNGNGNNSFVCTGGTSYGPGDCTIIQFASGNASNTARCVEQSGDSNSDQSCSIRQTSSTGSNTAQIQQSANANDGSAQLQTQYGGARQTSTTGSNTIQISQSLNQSTKDTDATGQQQQDGHQEAATLQNSSTGSNTVQITQSLSQKADAKGDSGSTITQSQNTDGDVNSNAGVQQYSTSGRNNASVNQDNWYDAHIHRALNGTQQQGSPGSSGEAVYFDQDSTGLSTIQAQQTEHQDLHADQVTNLTQNQYGPQWADPDQGSNPNDRYTINQDSHQNASDPSSQNDEQYALCFTSGNCTVSETIHQGNVSQSNSCSGSSCDVGNHAFNQGGESGQGGCTATPNIDSEFVSTCQPEDTPNPPFPPGVGD